MKMFLILLPSTARLESYTTLKQTFPYSLLRLLYDSLHGKLPLSPAKILLPHEQHRIWRRTKISGSGFESEIPILCMATWNGIDSLHFASILNSIQSTIMMSKPVSHNKRNVFIKTHLDLKFTCQYRSLFFKQKKVKIDIPEDHGTTSCMELDSSEF